MGVKDNSGDFARRMGDRGDQVISGTEKAIRQAAVVADQVVVSATPVKTGRARANWIVSFLRPSKKVRAAPKNKDSAGGIAINQGGPVIANWDLSKSPQIYITNNVDYIESLDQGTSAQAPEGMTAQAIAAAHDVLRRFGLLRGN